MENRKTDEIQEVLKGKRLFRIQDNLLGLYCNGDNNDEVLEDTLDEDIQTSSHTEIQGNGNGADHLQLPLHIFHSIDNQAHEDNDHDQEFHSCRV